MEIKKEDIIRLRKTSGQPIMDCKRALQETDSFDEAFEYLRKNATEKIDSRRKDKVVNEGRVISKCTHEQPIVGSRVAISSLLCETDFTAKSEIFINALDNIVDALFQLQPNAINVREVMTIINEVKAQTGEKIQMGTYHMLYPTATNPVYSYVHFDNKKAALVTLEAFSKPYELQQLGMHLAMHVVASKPRFLDESDIDWSEADLTIPEHLLSKPKEIIDKISRGKREKFRAETCMLYQPYCLDDSINVDQAIKKVRKDKMMEIQLKKFRHIEIGE